LEFEVYFKLLLLVCSGYDKKNTLPAEQSRAVYTAVYFSEDGHDPCDGTLDVEFIFSKMDIIHLMIS
jgi:hypothetical protein